MIINPGSFAVSVEKESPAKDLFMDTILFSRIKDLFNRKIPFNDFTGIRVQDLNYDNVSIIFDNNERLVGNYLRKTLHGGVIAAAIDVTGGLSAFMGLLQHSQHQSTAKKLQLFKKLSTIDLRIDFLKAGTGKYFTATGSRLKTGNRVVVTQIELRNDANQLIAVGTGTFMVS